jgi:hypothetical protein
MAMPRPDTLKPIGRRSVPTALQSTARIRRDRLRSAEIATASRTTEDHAAELLVATSVREANARLAATIDPAEIAASPIGGRR